MQLPNHSPKWRRATEEEDTQPLTPGLYTRVCTHTHTCTHTDLVIATSSGAQLLHHSLLPLSRQQTIPIRTGPSDQCKTSFQNRQRSFLSSPGPGSEGAAILGLAWALWLLFQCSGGCRKEAGPVGWGSATPALPWARPCSPGKGYG